MIAKCVDSKNYPKFSAVLIYYYFLNSKILNSKKEPTKERDCNCRKKDECPLRGKCCRQTVIYKAELKTANTTKNYIGCTENEFKTRYNGHVDSFRNENKKKTSTAL